MKSRGEARADGAKEALDRRAARSSESDSEPSGDRGLPAALVCKLREGDYASRQEVGAEDAARGAMLNAIFYYLAYYWRLFATGLCFTVFGLGAAIFGMLVFPVMRLAPGSDEAHRRRVRSTFRVYMRSFVGFMSAVGVLSYEFSGAERLGRPGQIILANHPSLIDVVFLIGFTPQATCVVKEALFHNPITRWPVAAAGYVSNTSTHSMVERASEALREGQNVIVFPEGTRTTPRQPMQFHRGAASIAVRAADVVTPVFIRCEPTTLAKNMRWYQIPDRRVRFSFRVGADIDPAPFRTQPGPLASRAFNTHLLKVFAAELQSDEAAAEESRAGETPAT